MITKKQWYDVLTEVRRLKNLNHIDIKFRGMPIAGCLPAEVWVSLEYSPMPPYTTHRSYAVFDHSCFNNMKEVLEQFTLSCNMIKFKKFQHEIE
jgi:hypothetical protein